jgi:hypothetical protein
MAKPEPVHDCVFTEHALKEMMRREISEEPVRKALATAEQMETVRKGRVVYQAKLDIGEPTKTYILRVFVDMDRKPPLVVTVYRTSKVEKYWR